MALDSEFIKAINECDIDTLRAMIINSFMIDPSLEQTKEMLSAAKTYKINIYQEHDGTNISDNKMDWTKEYFTEQAADLLSNFSQERIAMLKKYTPYVYKDYLEQNKPAEVSKKVTSPKVSTRQSAYVTKAPTIKKIDGINISKVAMTVGGIVILGLGILYLMSSNNE